MVYKWESLATTFSGIQFHDGRPAEYLTGTSGSQ